MLRILQQWRGPCCYIKYGLILRHARMPSRWFVFVFHTVWESCCSGLHQPPLPNEEPPANPDETAEARKYGVLWGCVVRAKGLTRFTKFLVCSLSAYLEMRIWAYTYMHTCIHTYIHTYIYIYIYRDRYMCSQMGFWRRTQDAMPNSPKPQLFRPRAQALVSSHHEPACGFGCRSSRNLSYASLKASNSIPSYITRSLPQATISSFPQHEGPGSGSMALEVTEQQYQDLPRKTPNPQAQKHRIAGPPASSIPFH